MFPAPFEYHDPTSVDETIALLARYGADAKLLAGGQSLIAAMNLGLVKPAVVIDLDRVGGLDGIQLENGTLRIGALVRHRTLERSAELRRACPLLTDAAALIGNPRVRARGTLGGSFAHADPSAELPAVAAALDAELRVVGPRGERSIRAGEFFQSALTTALAEDELLTEARLPTAGPRTGTAFEELARQPGDFAIVGVAAMVARDEGGACVEARLAFIGTGSAPALAPKAEARLRGTQLESGDLNDAARIAANEIEVEGDALVSAAYRRHLAGVLAGRALRRAVEQASGTAR